MYRNGDITGYIVMYSSATDSGHHNVSTTGLTVTIPDLEPGQYRVSVTGMNADRLGPYSAERLVNIIAQTPSGIVCAIFRYLYCPTQISSPTHFTRAPPTPAKIAASKQQIGGPTHK